jgi:outer membrane protein
MRSTKGKLLGSAAAAVLATAATGGAGAAQAQHLGQALFLEPVRGKQAGDVVVGLSAIGVLPENRGGRVEAIGGRPHASDSATAQLDVSYFFTPWLSANLIAATTRHDIEARGTALGTVDLGHVWALPPTLTLQVHPLPASRFSPYLGLGVNHTVFYAESGRRTPGIASVDVRNAWGMAVNFGADIELAPRWALNLDAKKILFLEPEALVNTATGTIRARADISPWVIGAGIRYRF